MCVFIPSGGSGQAGEEATVISTSLKSQENFFPGLCSTPSLISNQVNRKIKIRNFEACYLNTKT